MKSKTYAVYDTSNNNKLNGKYILYCPSTKTCSVLSSFTEILDTSDIADNGEFTYFHPGSVDTLLINNLTKEDLYTFAIDHPELFV